MAGPRKYPPELLDRGARVVIESGRPIAHVARDLGVPAETLRRHVRRVELADPTEQPLILYGSLRALSGRSLVVGGRRHVHDPADRLDAEAAAMLVDKAAHLGRSASSSVAKNTLAALRISLARRSS